MYVFSGHLSRQALVHLEHEGAKVKVRRFLNKADLQVVEPHETRRVLHRRREIVRIRKTFPNIGAKILRCFTR